MTPTEILNELSKAIAALNTILLGDGNTNITLGGVVKPSVTKHIETTLSTYLGAVGVNDASLFENKNMLTASSLPNDSFAVVYNDTITSNNGYYRKSSGVWAKTKWDPVEQAKNLVEKKTNAWKHITATTNLTLTTDDLEFSTLTFAGAMTEDVTITFPKIAGNWLVRQETTGGKSITLKVQDDSRTVTAVNGNVIEVHSNGALLLRVDNDRAPLASPQFTGTPRTGTAPTGTNSTQLATTEFAKRESHGSIYITLTNDTTEITESQCSFKNIVFVGALTADKTITLAASSGSWNMKNGTTGGFNVIVKSTNPPTVTLATQQVSKVWAISGSVETEKYNYAPLNSPQFLGIPKASTAPSGTRDIQIATTEFADRTAHGAKYITINDETTTVSSADCAYKSLVFTGTLTKDITLTLGVSIGDWNIRNATTGGFKLVLKSVNAPTVTISNKQNAKVWAIGGSVEITQQTLLPATTTALGGIKVGSGLAVSGDGTLSAIGGGGGSSVLTNYRGKFIYEGDYTVGDIVEHGSGIYECVANVTGTKSPQNNNAFLKKSNNLYAGADRKITTISTEVTSLAGKKPILYTQNGTQVFSNETWRYLFTSDDFGETWVEDHNFGGGKVGVVYPLDTGELLVTFEADGTPTIQQVWISTGWGTADCTWENTMSVQRAGIYFARGWGFSNYKNIILLSEYGPKYSTTTSGNGWTNIVGENSRYAYMSLDNGKTWKTIFDLNSLTDGVGVHVHGIVYDEYWQRIWISHGDSDYGSNGLWYSDDLGDTWVSALQTQAQGRNFAQVVGKFSLPTCLIFASDSYPNGLYRIDRSQGKYPAKGYYDIDVAYQIPNASQTGLNYLSHSNIKTRFTPDPIWIFSFLPEVLSGKSRILATFDGWKFFELYEDAQVFNRAKGIICVTATAKNEIIATATDDRFGAGVKTQIKLKVKIE